MEPELISKKELLRITGISYGQLYRWKRKNLIPEEWFIRKSTFTGQETFFPKQQILARIQRIMSMKDELSLDEIADRFSPAPELSLPLQDIQKQNIVSKESLDIFLELHPALETMSFEDILSVYVLDKLLQAGDIGISEGPVVIRTLEEQYATFAGKPCDLVFIRKLGVSTCLLTPNADDVRFESGAKIVSILNLQGCAEELRVKLL